VRLVAWLRSRGWRRLPKLPRWWPWTLLLLVPIVLINLAVSWVGRSAVFPLSPFYLGYKLEALGAYAKHRPGCLFSDDAEIAPLLAAAEQRHQLPCGLLGAIVHVESGGKPHRISSAGAMGPLQLIPPTARGLGVKDPFDPVESLDGAGRYLHAQLTKFHSIRLAAAAYNAGPGSIVGYAIPHNGQTEIYVARVMQALQTERRARCVAVRKPPPTPRSPTTPRIGVAAPPPSPSSSPSPPARPVRSKPERSRSRTAAP
jgi:Transglycosylase SLT domain